MKSRWQVMSGFGWLLQYKVCSELSRITLAYIPLECLKMQPKSASSDLVGCPDSSLFLSVLSQSLQFYTTKLKFYIMLNTALAWIWDHILLIPQCHAGLFQSCTDVSLSGTSMIWWKCILHIKTTASTAAFEATCWLNPLSGFRDHQMSLGDGDRPCKEAMQNAVAH